MAHNQRKSVSVSLSDADTSRERQTYAPDDRVLKARPDLAMPQSDTCGLASTPDRIAPGQPRVEWPIVVRAPRVQVGTRIDLLDRNGRQHTRRRRGQHQEA